MKTIRLISLLAVLSTVNLSAEVELRNAPEAVQANAAVEVVVSGIEKGKIYSEIPPVLVQLTGLKEGVDLWVEVYSGKIKWTKPGVALANHRELLWLDDVAVLNVPNLEKACNRNGTWTLVVMTKDRDETAVIAKTTFKVNRASQTVPRGFVSSP